MATKIKNEYTNFLDSILYYKGRGANNGVWESWEGEEDESEMIHLSKPHSWKDRGKIRVYYFMNEYPDLFTGHEFHIEMYITSYCEFYDMFEGWVDTLDELKTICKCVGIPDSIVKSKPTKTYTKERFIINSRPGCIFYTVKLNKETTLVEVRNLTGTNVEIDNIKYRIVGVETFAQSDDVGCIQYGILVKGI